MVCCFSLPDGDFVGKAKAMKEGFEFLDFKNPPKDLKEKGVTFKVGEVAKIAFNFPEKAIQADDNSGPWIGIFKADANGQPLDLVNNNGWYRATKKRMEGFEYEAKFMPAAGKYVFLMVANGGDKSKPLSALPVEMK